MGVGTAGQVAEVVAVNVDEAALDWHIRPESLEGFECSAVSVGGDQIGWG